MLRHTFLQILAMWILAAKLPNSDLKFAAFLGGLSSYIPRKKAPNNPQEIPRKIHLETCSDKFPHMSAEAFP